MNKIGYQTNSKKSKSLMRFDQTKSKNILIKIHVTQTLYFTQAIFKIIDTPVITLKSFLLICVLASSGLCSYLIIELILSYPKSLNFSPLYS
jgi:hypothetical protein